MFGLKKRQKAAETASPLADSMEDYANGMLEHAQWLRKLEPLPVDTMKTHWMAINDAGMAHTDAVCTMIRSLWQTEE